MDSLLKIGPSWLALVSGIGAFMLLKHTILSHRVLLIGAIFIFVATPFIVDRASQQWPKNPSLNRRASLNHAAWNIFSAYPLAGVGLNNFTAYEESFSPNREVVRFVQPAHHVGLLWLAETGLVGGILVLLGGRKIWKKLHDNQQKSAFLWCLFLVLPLAAFDHYLLTQQTGFFLIIFSFYLSQPSNISHAPQNSN